MRKLFLTVFLSCICLGAEAVTDKLYPEPVVAKNGGFYVGDKRIRLWGVNLAHWHTRNHEGAELTLKRIKDMGFNSVALWVSRGAFQDPKGPATKFRAPKKGDGSMGDLFDYVIHRARKEKLYIAHTFLQRVFPQYVTAADYDIIPGGNDGDRTEWLKAVKAMSREFGCAKFIDERVRELYFRKARWMLERINPYTGLRYADDNSVALYEQADEEGFIVKAYWARGWRHAYWGKSLARKYNAYLRAKYIDNGKLKSAWSTIYDGEDLAKGTIDLFGPGMRSKSFSKARWEDTTAFLYKLTRKYHTDFHGMLRSLSKKGTGINAQPIAVDSIIYTKPAGLYTATTGSFICGTSNLNGGGEMIEKSGKWQWTHWAERQLKTRPLEVDGFAYAPLAGSVKRPNPYRSGNPVARAVYGSWQDHDGVYFYWWGYFAKKIPYTAENFTREALTYGTPEKRKGGFEILADEVVLSAARAAGAAFLNRTIAPAKNPTKFILGRDLLFSAKAFDYVEKVWPEISATAFKYGARIKFDPQRAGLMHAEGKVLKKPPSLKLIAGKEITYDHKNGFVKVDAEMTKIFSGNSKKRITFAGPVTLEGATQPFITFVLTARDGRAIATSHDMTASLVSTSDNKGFVFIKSKVTKHKRFKFAEVHNGVAYPGASPVIIKRVGAKLTLPKLQGRRCRKIDFKMKTIADVPADEGVTIKQSEPVFALEFYVK